MKKLSILFLFILMNLTSTNVNALGWDWYLDIEISNGGDNLVNFPITICTHYTNIPSCSSSTEKVDAGDGADINFGGYITFRDLPVEFRVSIGEARDYGVDGEDYAVEYQRRHIDTAMVVKLGKHRLVAGRSKFTKIELRMDFPGGNLNSIYSEPTGSFFEYKYAYSDSILFGIRKGWLEFDLQTVNGLSAISETSIDGGYYAALVTFKF